MYRLSAFALLVGLTGCDLLAPGGTLPDPGDAVEIVAEAADRPTSREGYASLAAFVAFGTGRVVLVRPGTGPADPPRFVRAFHTPWAIAQAAQVDADGYLWLAAPYYSWGAKPSLYKVVVLDPHAAVVHRVIELPEGVVSVTDLIVTPEAVVFRPWDSERLAALAAVDPACVRDVRQCEARVWAALGHRSRASRRAFHTSGDTLFSFSARFDGASVLDLVRLSTGERLGQADSVGTDATVGPDAIHHLARIDGVMHVVRLDRATLAVTARVPATDVGEGREDLIARQGDRLYTSASGARRVVVRDAATLAVMATHDLAAEVEPVFGFVAPDVLLLNGQTALDVTTGRLIEGVAPDLGGRSKALRLPPGRP